MYNVFVSKDSLQRCGEYEMLEGVDVESMFMCKSLRQN